MKNYARRKLLLGVVSWMNREIINHFVVGTQAGRQNWCALASCSEWLRGGEKCSHWHTLSAHNEDFLIQWSIIKFSGALGGDCHRLEDPVRSTFPALSGEKGARRVENIKLLKRWIYARNYDNKSARIIWMLRFSSPPPSPVIIPSALSGEPNSSPPSSSRKTLLD